MSEYCSATVYGPRVQHWQCQRKAAVQRDGKWYCKQHDPEAVKARDAARNAKWKAEDEANERIGDRARALARKLGCGRPSFARSGYGCALVLSFKEVEKLIEQLSVLRQMADGDRG